jgi:hypothetical protein
MRKLLPRVGIVTVAVTAAACTLLGLPGGSASAGSVVGTVPPGISSPPGSGTAAHSFRIVSNSSGSVSNSPICYYGACYDYVYDRQVVTNTGTTIAMTVGDPKLDPADAGDPHSLQEIADMSLDSSFIIEVGWTVDKGLNGDLKPHLFVYHWVNGSETCYNGCGFVSTSRLIQPGMTLLPGMVIDVGFRQHGGNWYVLFDGIPFGYFPGSLWDNQDPTAQWLEAFGEVEDTTLPACTQMGDGRYGTSLLSSWMGGYQLYGASAAPDLSGPYETSPSYYDYGFATPTAYHLGGPGDCASS